MIDALSYPFFQRAVAAGLLAAVACGIVGTWVVVKQFASISGGLAHAAFGGLGLGYLVGFSPMLGAAGFGLASGVGIGLAHRRLTEGFETLVMVVWSLGMALGILFVAAVPGYAPDLTTYLFGNILFVSPTYLLLAAGLDVVLLAAVALFFRQLQGVAFDEEFSEVLGVPVTAVLVGLLALTSLVVVLLIRVVGVLLVIALLTIPAATVRPWARGLGHMMVLSTLAGGAAILLGLFGTYVLSASFGVDVPTGPVIVVLAVVGYLGSALAGRAGSR